MSTQGIVAVGTPRKWAHGIWIAHDAYESHAGAILKTAARDLGLRGLEGLIKKYPDVADHIGGLGLHEGAERYSKATMTEHDYLFAAYIYLVSRNEIVVGSPVYHLETHYTDPPTHWKVIYRG